MKCKGLNLGLTMTRANALCTVLLLQSLDIFFCKRVGTVFHQTINGANYVHLVREDSDDVSP